MHDTVPAPLTLLVISAKRALARFRRVRSLYLIALAILTGVLAGLVVTVISWTTQQLHVAMFAVPVYSRLSAQVALAQPWMALLPAAGGILMGISIVLTRRFRTRPPVDPIEANAVHGGQMSVRESLIVTVQTIISSSFGASVGLEAGYTQMSSGLASNLAARLKLRRNEVRLLVGCAAAGAIAAAFNAPITGAFYAYELVIGLYSVTLLAPVVAASVAASFTASKLGAVQTQIEVGSVSLVNFSDIVPFLMLGLVGGGIAILVMQAVAWVEQGFSFVKCPSHFRPFLGGLVVGGLALITPQVLSSGHGALHAQLHVDQSLMALAVLLLLKIVASTVSLGSGFRGGLFFASLFLGALLGKIFADIGVATGIFPHLDPILSAVVGMASLAVGVVGGPLTMTFLVLETTGDLAISVAVLAASLVSAVLVRETFGYSFSTWRLHLRGETIRSAHDVGRLRNLTVGSMMRAGVKTVLERMTLAEFRDRYPLGSTERVIATDAAGHYAGIALVADAHHALNDGGSGAEPLSSILKHTDRMLLPGLNAKDAAEFFEKYNSEEFAVVDNIKDRRVIGLLTEAYLLRRYAEELDKGWKDLTGET
jgi:CIC family chloride channel protein